MAEQTLLNTLQAVNQSASFNRWAGFKVYHVFAARPDTFNAGTEEFLPDWAWYPLGIAYLIWPLFGDTIAAGYRAYRGDQP